MHNAAFAHLGLAADYQALDVLPQQLQTTLEMLRKTEVYGANVTIPHKLAVMPLLDELSDTAKAIGAVNTIINNDGWLLGHNTDAAGFLRALSEDAGFDPQGQTALMIGAGGAARAVAYALLKAGVGKLMIYNRSQARAQALANDFSELGQIFVLAKTELSDRAKSADLLVNCSSVGMAKEGCDPNISPLPATALPRTGLVCDIIYRPAQTKLLRDASSQGLKTQNGLAMLVYQGAESFKAWTGLSAPVAVMRAAAQTELNHS